MSYEINKDTCAIIPLGKNKSRIIERNNEYIINDNPYQVMEHSCEYFGSSLSGRLAGSKGMLGAIYKSPILVEESKNIIFFPTESPTLFENIWVSLNNIEKYEKYKKKTIIYFRNGKEIVVNVPYLSVENQILRSSRLASIVNSRKNYEKND